MSTTTVGVVSRPDPEVRPAAKVYSAAFKAEVLAELDAADSRVERGEIIRRRGLYSQLIHHWRVQRDRAGLGERPMPGVDFANVHGRCHPLSQRSPTLRTMTSERDHWERVWTGGVRRQMSWFQETAEP